MTRLFDTTGDLYRTSAEARGAIQRYAVPQRPVLEGLIAATPRLAEVAQTFPALLFALATAYGTDERRQITIQLIRQGAPLRTVAAALGLPWWLRRLPPESFQEPLHGVPVCADFALRVANLVPEDAADGPSWLARTLFAYRCVGADYALWIARQRRFPSGLVGEISETLLAAWAWHARQPHTLGHPLLRTPWTDSVSLRRALDEAKAWSMRIDLAVALGAGIEDPWFPAGAHGPYEFVPLLRLDQFLAEAASMSNCLDQFADNVRAGRSRVFSIRKGGRVVADVEIGAHEDDCCIPRIVQLRGPRNRRAGPEIWQAALAWLARQEFRPLPRGNETADRLRRQQLIRTLWLPMLASLKGTRAEKRVQALAFGKELSPSFRAFQAATSDRPASRAEPAAGRGDAADPVTWRRDVPE